MESLHSGGLRLSHWRVYDNTTKGAMPVVQISTIILILFKGMPLNSQSLSPWCTGYCLYVTAHIQIQGHLLISDIECTAENSLSKSNYHFKTIKSLHLIARYEDLEKNTSLGIGQKWEEKVFIKQQEFCHYQDICTLLPNIIQCANSQVMKSESFPICLTKCHLEQAPFHLTIKSMNEIL